MMPSDHLTFIIIGAVHSSQGYMVILIAISLSAIDIISTVRRLFGFIKNPNKSFKNFWRCIMNKDVEDIKTSEYDALIQNESEQYSMVKVTHDSVEFDDFERNNNDNAYETPNTTHQHHRHYSVNSDRTMFESHSPTRSEDTLHDVKIRQNTASGRALLSLVGHSAFAVVERALVLAGFAQLLLGVVTYSGKAFVFTPFEPPFIFL